ncbi:hypothetical protein [Leuconostoc carnosum]|uniref:hypothetical protein n=1 Tax=Leuconostoc carnosum TaxID=1252 RepID=UPI000D507CB4|nr:hypothetical protein [Leuconostoc carnosum]KAA8364567.1 hypothetical protein FE416_09310 [Leuconostoc carnosum]KAA8373663.1 hypothetical protein FE412_01750 [Leuconostoc carnosum]KAA8377140.1 hypothetical protein FE405_07495 [Leuconostoc carnosum]SPJ44075.1 hypothetical protein LCAC16_80159 [Leuconostoc carnosum]
MGTEWLFTTFPNSKGEVTVVLWEREKFEDPKFASNYPFRDSMTRMHTENFSTTRDEYLSDVKRAKDELIVRAGLLSDDVFNYETSLPDFDNKEMVFGDWE